MSKEDFWNGPLVVAGITIRFKLNWAVPNVAVTVTVCVEVTAVVVIVKDALLWPAATLTVAGT